MCDKRLGRRKNKAKQISAAVLALIAEPFAAGPLNACKASPADARWVFPAGGWSTKKHSGNNLRSAKHSNAFRLSNKC